MLSVIQSSTAIVLSVIQSSTAIMLSVIQSSTAIMLSYPELHCDYVHFYEIFFYSESASLHQNASNWAEHGDNDELKELKSEVGFLTKKLAVADQELQAADVLRKDLEGTVCSCM